MKWSAKEKDKQWRQLTAIHIMLFICTACVKEEIPISFGFVEYAGAHVGLLVKRETTRIPYLLKETTGFQFGYTIHAPLTRAFHSYAIHYLPSPPARFSGPLSSADVKDAQRGVRTRELLHVGITTIALFFEQGDPLGQYRVDIYLDGRFAKSIIYDVVKPEE